MRNKIMAIDPGPSESAYVVVEHDGREITRVAMKDKVQNEALLNNIRMLANGCDIAMEMVASYGMPVGREVFETCVWIGRFLQEAGVPPAGWERAVVYRIEEKTALCHSAAARDSNIRQALVDRYAPGAANSGKGTKKEPGFFYGFRADVWQAMAVAVAWFEREVKK